MKYNNNNKELKYNSAIFLAALKILCLMVIYNGTWQVLVRWIRALLSGDNLRSVLPVCNKP